MIQMMEFQDEDLLDTLTIMIGTYDISRIPVKPDTRWELLFVRLFNELKEKYKPRLVVLCTDPHNRDKKRHRGQVELDDP